MQLPTDRTELILHFQPKAERTISAFLWGSPHFSGIRDDLVSVAYVKTIEAIDRFLAKKEINHAHLANYVRISILTGVSDFIRDNSTIRAPKNKWVGLSQLVGDAIDPISLDDRLTGDRIRQVCRTTSEKVIANMTLNGATRKEIAEFLCMPQREVRKIAGDILERARSNG